MIKKYCDRCGKEVSILYEVCGYGVCPDCQLDYTRAINVVEDAWIRGVKNQELKTKEVKVPSRCHGPVL